MESREMKNSSVFSNQMYSYERGTGVHLVRTTSWSGKIALAYPSDYGCATDFNYCTQTLYYYDVLTSTSVSLMRAMFDSTRYNWLLSTNSNSSGKRFIVGKTGYVDGSLASASTYNYLVVRPVLYLNSIATIESGNGTARLPYKLSANYDKRNQI